jgi:hypothetical protein
LQPSEAEFRRIESTLDDLLKRDAAALARHDITFTDHSARHYYSDVRALTWCYWFESRRPRASEIEKITIIIQYEENTNLAHRAETEAISLVCRSEIFQIGATSRYSKSTSSTCSLNELLEGIAPLVVPQIQSARLEIAKIS